MKMLKIIYSIIFLLFISDFAYAEKIKENLDSNKKPVVPKALCQRGMFEIGSDPVSFEDVILEGNNIISLNKKGIVTFYGYVKDIIIGDDPNKRSEAVIFDGEECYSKVALPNYKVKMDIIWNPVGSKPISQDEYREIKRKLIRMKDGSALVKIHGSFGMYSNTFSPYFNAKDIEIIVNE